MRRSALPFALLVLAVVALVASPAPAFAEVTRTIKADLSPGSGSWMIENLAGRMTVVTGSGSGVVATATIHAESDELAALLSFEEVSGGKAGGGLRVRYPVEKHTTYRYPNKDGAQAKWLSWLGSSGSSNFKYDGTRVSVSSNDGVLLYADVEVQVPARLGAGSLRNHVGSIVAKGVEGSLTFVSGSGDVDLDKVAGTIGVETGSGDVEAHDATGTLTISTGSGDVRVEHFSGETIGCEVGSGDVTLRAGTARKVNIDTGSGDVEALSMDVEEFDTDTGSGDVLFEASGTRLSRVTSDAGSGDVTLRLFPSAGFEVTADQGSGDLVNRFKDAQAIVRGREVIGWRRGDARIHIDVTTGSGDVVVEPGDRASV
jgi:putative adhesin